MTIQAWSPFQYGFFEGIFIGSEKYPELNKNLEELAKKYGISFFIVGHITKDGKVAGPKLLEHMVDAVFNF